MSCVGGEGEEEEDNGDEGADGEREDPSPFHACSPKMR